MAARAATAGTLFERNEIYDDFDLPSNFLSLFSLPGVLLRSDRSRFSPYCCFNPIIRELIGNIAHWDDQSVVSRELFVKTPRQLLPIDYYNTELEIQGTTRLAQSNIGGEIS